MIPVVGQHRARFSPRRMSISAVDRRTSTRARLRRNLRCQLSIGDCTHAPRLHFRTLDQTYPTPSAQRRPHTNNCIHLLSKRLLAPRLLAMLVKDILLCVHAWVGACVFDFYLLLDSSATSSDIRRSRLTRITFLYCRPTHANARQIAPKPPVQISDLFMYCWCTVVAVSQQKSTLSQFLMNADISVSVKHQYTTQRWHLYTFATTTGLEQHTGYENQPAVHLSRRSSFASYKSASCVNGGVHTHSSNSAAKTPRGEGDIYVAPMYSSMFATPSTTSRGSRGVILP